MNAKMKNVMKGSIYKTSEAVFIFVESHNTRITSFLEVWYDVFPYFFFTFYNTSSLPVTIPIPVTPDRIEENIFLRFFNQLN
jgi:hypothetical protein